MHEPNTDQIPQYRPPYHNPGPALVFWGAGTTLVALILWLWTSNATAECSSIIVRAFNQAGCQRVTIVHGIGTWLMAVGIAILVIGGLTWAAKHENNR